MQIGTDTEQAVCKTMWSNISYSCACLPTNISVGYDFVGELRADLFPATPECEKATCDWSIMFSIQNSNEPGTSLT